MHGSFFDQFLGFFQALDPSIKRYAQTKRLLTGGSFGALKLFCNFARRGFSSARVSSRFVHLPSSKNDFAVADSRLFVWRSWSGPVKLTDTNDFS